MQSYTKHLNKPTREKVQKYKSLNNTFNTLKQTMKIHPIIHLLSHCEEVASNSFTEFTIAALCDLSKASNVIHFEKLLNKWDSE